MNTSQKVLILGAGPSGLVLAQILRAQNIPHEIFDRDDGTLWQGWGIALDTCLDTLYPLLPPDIRDPKEASPNFSRGELDSFWIVNGVTHEFIGLLGNIPKGQPGHVIHVDRAAVRKILMQNLEVQLNKNFVRYEEDEEGVKVFFSDGSTAHGSVLVAADGASSRVRGQLLPGFNASVSKYTNIQGHVTVSPSLAAQVLGQSKTGVLVADRDQKANCLVMQFHPSNDTVTLCWFLAYKTPEWEKEQTWARSASGEELKARAMERTAHWPEFLKRVVRETKPEGIHRPPIRLLETVLPGDELPRGKVTLVGDAMHSMLPFRGMGANMGISGACLLGQGLIKGFRSGKKVDEVLREYEREWIPKTRKAVLESHAAGEGDENDDLSGGRLEEQKAAANATA